MKIFKLPLLEIYVEPLTILSSYQDYVCVDGVGLYVEYNDIKELEPALIRKSLKGKRDTWCYIKAASAEEAIVQFHTEWKGAKIGEKNKALTINKKNHILELPACPKQEKNKNRYVCGQPEDKDISPTGCILSGYDPGDNCPIGKFFDEVNTNFRSSSMIAIKTVNVKPYGAFITVRSLFPAPGQ